MDQRRVDSSRGEYRHKYDREDLKQLKSPEGPYRRLQPEDVPRLNFDLEYAGKIMAFLANGKVVLRGQAKMHKDIVAAFQNEVGTECYTEAFRSLGGAWFRYDPDKKMILVYGSSVDYGPLKDIEGVRTSLKSAFPEISVSVTDK